MRIAFISQPWSQVAPPVEQADSIAIWTYEVARRLAEHADVLVCSRRCADQAPSELRAGVEYRRLWLPSATKVGRAVSRRLDAAGLSPAFHSPWFQPAYGLGAALEARRAGADIVHIHNFSQYVPVVRELNPRARIVLHMHCEWLSELDRELVARRLLGVDAVFGCSEHVTEKVRERFPEIAGRCHTLPNGVFVDDKVLADGAAGSCSVDGAAALGVLFVGRVTPEKGLHDLVDAFVEVAGDFPEARLDIVGPDAVTPREYLVDLAHDPRVRALGRFYESDYLAELERRVPTPLRARVRFWGEIARSELRQRYASAAVLANPSLSESFGMSLVEAMAVGLPVVAARTGGMCEIVEDGTTGLLVEPASPKALAHALSRLLADAELRRAFGSAGRRRVAAAFSWDRISEAALALYRTIERGA